MFAGRVNPHGRCTGCGADRCQTSRFSPRLARAWALTGRQDVFEMPDKFYADGGHQGPEFQNTMKDIMVRGSVEIVTRSDQVAGLAVRPKR